LARSLASFFLTLTTERLSIPDGWRLILSVGFVGAVASTLVGLAAVFFAAWVARRI